jgi:putative hydrolase of the HAD superfamily
MARLDIAAVETWVFDLDNTLYPATYNVFAQVDRRMGEFVADFLGVSYDEAKLVQKRLFRTYGTTLRGLMLEHGMVPGPFLDYVHELDLSLIPRHDRLNEVLYRLPGRKLIFTNGTVPYAERVVAQLGLDGHFEAVHDIVACAYLPKPDRSGYEAMCERYEIAPTSTVMIEDIAKNLLPAHEMGMTTVWVPANTEWSSEGVGPHVHHVAPDLAEFLEQALDGS